MILLTSSTDGSAGGFDVDDTTDTVCLLREALAFRWSRSCRDLLSRSVLLRGARGLSNKGFGALCLLE